MVGSVKRVLALILCGCVCAYASGNDFKVRYNGGSVASKVDPKDWDNRLTVTADAITLELKDKSHVDIPPKSVTSISYGQEAHRRVGTMIALAVLVAPVALFGLFHKTRLHYVGIQYKTSEGKDSGILLQGDKDNYRAILVALQGVTGAPVSVAEKDREYVPVGVTTRVSKDSEGSAGTNQLSAQSVPSQSASSSLATSAQIDVVSTPPGADIEIDGKFVGSTPSSITVAPGDHAIAVKKNGFAVWDRKVTVSSGHVNINAELTAQPK
jgi:hypothetical protein